MTTPPGTPVRPPRRAVNGLLLLDKPSGFTSNAALQKVRWLFGARKAGHTGSLDPLASGLLPLCFGEATKFSAYLLEADKTYQVQLRFGVKTDTGDADGAVVETSTRTAVDKAELENALARMRGPLQQVPPMYSALKQGGQRLYALARAGHTVPRAPRPVVVHRFDLEVFHPECPTLTVRCSKGTYVRVLVEDLAAELGTLAHVVMLRRTGVGGIQDGPMRTLAEVQAAAETGVAELDRLLLPVDTLVKDYPAIALGLADAEALLRGRPVAGPAGGAAAPGLVRLYGPAGRFLGLGEVMPDARIHPRRLISGPGA